MFTEQDRVEFNSRGVDIDQVKAQINRFQTGFPFTILNRPCTVNDGIKQITDDEVNGLTAKFDQAAIDGRVSKFVPASGAGSRMFKSLLAEHNQDGDKDFNAVVRRAADNDDAAFTIRFFEQLHRYPFFEDICSQFSLVPTEDTVHSNKYAEILEYILTDNGLNFPELPKGLLPFHRYNNHVRTPFAEHLTDAKNLIRDSDDHVNVNFTVSPEHLGNVKNHINEWIKTQDDKVRFEISYSTQQVSTDTVAVEIDGQPFRNTDGTILFRAGGHGALLENLNRIEGDIVFIGNIDNVTYDHYKPIVYKYKKILGGYLIETQNQIFTYLDKIDQADTRLLAEILNFCSSKLCIVPPDSVHKNRLEQIEFIRKILDRPIRICGMVKNTGEPGGGPFWVSSGNGTVSPQIVESAQVDLEDTEQRNIFSASTHFNPVDLVCGLRDRHGKPFNLHKFRDPNTGFISTKSKDGRPLKAMEHPGLWNGSMAEWNTVFIEVPAETFNPVKSIEDLLRPAHQPAT